MFGWSKAERKKKAERRKKEKVEALTREALIQGASCPESLGMGNGNCGLRAETYQLREHLNLQGTHLVVFTCPRGHEFWTGFDAEFDEPRKAEAVNSDDLCW